MKVESILDAKGRSVETIRPDAPVDLAIHRLTDKRIGALVVSADGSRVEGVITERDVVRALARHGTRLLELPVARVMSPAVVCAPDATIRDAMATMTRTRHRHLPVVADGAVVGLVSIGDVVKHRLEEMELEASVLRDAYIATR
jgi:CBS domain-containing protein